MTKVVVLEKFKKNWEIGSVVSVKDGYARNYLIPTGKAKFATKQNIEEIKSIEESLIKKDDENKSIAINIASKITGILIIIRMIFHLIFYYRSNFFNFKSILHSKFSLISLIIGFLTISISLYYRYYVTGNPVYPLFANFFTPSNQLFINFELEIRNYMRGFLFPLKIKSLT